MSTDVESGQQTLEFERGDLFEFGGPDTVFGAADFDDERPLRPVDWNVLSADEALLEWDDLNRFVKWLCHSYGLPPAVVPPLWHRHDELIWELSALHIARVNAYDPEGSPAGPLAWHREFHKAKQRLREWVSLSGTRLDRDRPTRQTAWPGEAPYEPAPEVEILDRDADFAAFVAEDVAARRAIEEQVRAAS
ncbi:MAG: hypothetical protein QM714_08585 [Nocardioides sp.]|uniref:hypothetical protein n=1 Tax=Nocardioides sp. TaxID=35761 RepID=UPI0039E27786